MQDLDGKITGNTLGASEWNEPMTELQNIITQSGQALSGGDLNQVGKGIAKLGSGGDFGTDSGSANLVTLTQAIGMQVPTALFTGMTIRFYALASNSGATTVTAFGLPNKKLLSPTQGALVTGDKIAGVYYIANYLATADGGVGAFILVNIGVAPTVATGTNLFPPAYLTGMQLSNNSTTAINFGIGSCKDALATIDMTLATAFGKTFATWVTGGTVGAPNGGLAGGAVVNNTWYRAYIISTNAGVLQAGFDLASNSQAQALLILAGVSFTKYRQVGWVRYGVGAPVLFIQTGDKFFLQNGSQISTTIPATANRTLYTAIAPPDATCVAVGSMSFNDGTQSNVTRFLAIQSTAVTDAVVSATNCTHTWVEGSVQFTQQCFYYEVPVNTSSQFGARISGSTLSLASINSIGWVDTRGA